MPKGNPKRMRLVKRKAANGPAKILSPEVVRKVELNYQIMEMRRKGFTIREIAETLNISGRHASECLKLILKEAITDTAETTEEHRQIELERYDAILKQYFPLSTQGNLAATAVVLQVSAQRRKLLALDIPEIKKLDVTGVREYIGVDMDQV